MQLTKDKFQPWLDISLGKLPEAVYARVDKSTVFELSWNPSTEDADYIDQKNASTTLKGYQPELPQEIVLDKDNPLYAFMEAYAFGFPTGSDAIVPFLLVKPNIATGEPTDAILWREAELHPDKLNTPDGKLSFNIELNGSPEFGTAALAEGKMKFTPVEASQGIQEPVSPVTVKAGATAKAGFTAKGGGHFVYASADPATATIDTDGTVHGVKSGSTKVYALLITADGRYTAEADVTVN